VHAVRELQSAEPVQTRVEAQIEIDADLVVLMPVNPRELNAPLQSVGAWIRGVVAVAAVVDLTGESMCWVCKWTRCE